MSPTTIPVTTRRFTRRAPQAVRQEPASRLLRLTEREAEALLNLCIASPACGGEPEARLFAKLGTLLRNFWREEERRRDPRVITVVD